MLCDDGQRVAIIDFGISSLMNSGSTVLMTQTGMTPAYSAPETFRDLYLVESDYFSFGVLLLELYCGHLPYAGLSQTEVARYAAIQRIPIPEDIPSPLASLIAALTYPDLTNRGKTENPNRRWTYAEVKNWLEGVEQPVPGGMVGKTAMKSFQFMGNAYTDTQKFAEALALHWEEGKHLLFHSKLANHFSTCNLDAAKWCRKAESEARQSSGHDDRIYWKLLCRLAPGQTQFWWKGQRYESLPAFGRELLEKLWSNDKSILSIADSILSEGMLTAFVQEKDPKNEKLMRVAQALEDRWHEACEADKDPYLTYYAMAYALSGQKVMMIDGRKIHTVSELSDLLKEKLEVSLQVFQDFCHTLVDVYGSPDVQLEAWLIAIGKGEQLRRWRDRMNGIQEDNE